MVVPSEILPGDYICRVNDFEVSLETTEQEIFDMIRNILVPIKAKVSRTVVTPKEKGTRVVLRRKSVDDENAKAKPPVLRLTIARNHHETIQVGKKYKPLSSAMYYLEPAPKVLWRTFTNINTGIDVTSNHSQHGCRIKKVDPDSIAKQLGILANDQVVQIGTRVLSGSSRNALINDWLKADILRSRYGEAIVKFARASSHSSKQLSDPYYLADIVNNASRVRYRYRILYRNKSLKHDLYNKRVQHAAVSADNLRKFLVGYKDNQNNYLSVARQWVYAKTQIINQEIVRYLSGKRILKSKRKREIPC